MSGCLGIIPARGGSKGIPGKNIRPVGGKPLIAWTLECARSVSALQRTLVTTDCEKIAAVAREWGGEVPFLRPGTFARDDTPGVAPVLHTLAWLRENESYEPEWIVHLQPTSPLRIPEDVEAAIKLAESAHADAVVTVCEAHPHPYWMKWMTPDGELTDFVADADDFTSRQQLPPVYALNGAIAVVRVRSLLATRSFFGGRTLGYAMPPERSVDIDTPWDLEIANWMLKQRLA